MIVLDTIVAMFSCYCNDRYSVEMCEIQQPNGDLDSFPRLNYRHQSIDVNRINRKIGINESADNVVDLLTRMCLKATDQGSNQIQVKSNN